MQEYERLKKEYYARFPKEENEKSIEALQYSYGLAEAVRILNEARDRFIVITYSEQGNDIIDYSFEER